MMCDRYETIEAEVGQIQARAGGRSAIRHTPGVGSSPSHPLHWPEKVEGHP